MVESESQLRRALEQWLSCEVVGIDTEFVREKTFHAELCLVQVEAGGEIFCADPMGLDASNERDAALWAGLARPAWVLHSGRQDLEVIYQSAGLLPPGFVVREAISRVLARSLLRMAKDIDPVETAFVSLRENVVRRIGVDVVEFAKGVLDQLISR